MKREVEFYSEGFRLCGDIYMPDDLQPGEKRAAVLLCHGYTGVKDLYLPDNAKVLNQAGYVGMVFDYKGWGESEGTRSRLAPYSRVLDVQAAMTFLGMQPEVDSERIGLYGTSYGGATVTWVGAVDQRAKCIVSVVGIGNGARWLSRVRRMDEWFDLLERSKADREKRATTGKSELVDRGEILPARPAVCGAGCRGSEKGSRSRGGHDHPSGVRGRYHRLQSRMDGRQNFAQAHLNCHH